MKGKNTISTFELFELFPDQEAARIYLEGRLWPDGVRCSCCIIRRKLAFVISDRLLLWRHS